MVAIACLFLAGKVEEQTRKLETVVLTCHQQFFGGAKPQLKPDSKATLVPEFHSLVAIDPRGLSFITLLIQEYEELRNSVIKCERVLLHTITFDLYVKHPYHFLIEAVKDVQTMGVSILCI